MFVFVHSINLPLSTCQALIPILKEHGILERDRYELRGNYLISTLIRVTPWRALNPARISMEAFLGRRSQISFDLKDG